ncbi:MAG: hypothetical protein J7L35_05975, partial [Anaerolineales bacterium]|nr:hypothetical protein [Anaerolineales bacterium]
QPIQGNYKIINLNGIDHLQIDLTNLMVLPVELKELNINGSGYSIDRNWCGINTCQDKIIGDYSSFVIADHSEISLVIPMSKLNFDLEPVPAVYLKAILWGGSTLTENPLSTNYVPEGVFSGTRPRTELLYALENHPFLEQITTDELAVLPGTWEVTGDLILPDGVNLVIPAGTTLLFETDAVLVVNGSLNLEGLPDDPIQLTAQHTSWGGILVLGNGSTESNWTHAEVNNTAGIIRGGWVLTGGITFYENNPHFQQVKISANTAEDALNIIRSDFTFQEVDIYQSTSDAIDGDFTQGTITDCRLENITGDGLDFSGSVVSITNSAFLNIGDKAISVGENSIVSISESTIENTNFGIASKDLSEVVADTLTITNARVAGLAAYIKKPQYGPAYLNADQITFINTAQPAVCQTGSSLILSGNSIRCEDIDVESFYE